jgi:hypothetical protein
MLMGGNNSGAFKGKCSFLAYPIPDSLIGVVITNIKSPPNVKEGFSGFSSQSFL